MPATDTRRREPGSPPHDVRLLNRCHQDRTVAWVVRSGRALVVVGLALVTTGVIGSLITACLVTPHSAAGVGWLLAGCLAISGLGSGLVISPNQALTLANVPVPRAGVAGSMQQLGQRLGGAVGVAVVLATFDASSSAHPGTDLAAGLGAVAAALGIALALATATFAAGAASHPPTSARNDDESRLAPITAVAGTAIIAWLRK